MPRLKGIQCSIELKGSSLPLREYETWWVEGAVECYVAIPSAPTDFTCNRFKRGLLPRGKDGSLDKSKVNFRFKQKEELLHGGRMLAHPWRFERLNIVAADATRGLQLADPDIIQNVGTIEVIVLRGQDNPEYPHFNPYTIPRLPKSPQQSRRRITQAKNDIIEEGDALSGLFDGPSDDPLSDYPLWQVDGRGSGPAHRCNTRYQHGPPPRTSANGIPRHEGYVYVDETDDEEWETEGYYVEAPSPPRPRRHRYREQDGYEHGRHHYGTTPCHTRREYLHQQSFQSVYDNEEDDRRQYEAFRAGLYAGREDARYTNSSSRRYGREERHTGRAPAGNSAARSPRGHTVVINQFPASNAKNFSNGATDGPDTLPRTYRVVIPLSHSFESSSHSDSSQSADQYRQDRPNKSSPRHQNVSGSTDNTEDVIQDVEPLVRKIVKDIVKDVVEHLPGKKTSSKKDGEQNFHYNREPEKDGDTDDELMGCKSMPGAYPSSTSRVCYPSSTSKVCIRYRSGNRDALPASSTSCKATNHNKAQIPSNANRDQLEYETADQSIDLSPTDGQLILARPLVGTQDLANCSNDLGTRSNVSFKPSRQNSPSASRRHRSASQSRPAPRSSHSRDGKRQSSSRAKGQSQDNENDWDRCAGDGWERSSSNDGVSEKNRAKEQNKITETTDAGYQSNSNGNAGNKENNWDNPNDQHDDDWGKSKDVQNNGWNNQEDNWDQSNNWGNSNDQQGGNDDWNQNNDNDWGALAQQQIPDWDHTNENNNPPPPEAKESKLPEKSKRARSLSISQYRPYWYKRPGDDAHTPPAGLDEYNQPPNATRKRHINAADAEIAQIHPEQPQYTIPEAAAKARHVEHQVRGGKGLEKEHKVGRPIYWDTFDKPYAVIRFKYRSKKCLEELLQDKIAETEEEFRERLGVLTKEQLIEECVRRKKNGGGSDSGKDEDAAKPAVQQPELLVPWP